MSDKFDKLLKIVVGDNDLNEEQIEALNIILAGGEVVQEYNEDTDRWRLKFEPLIPRQHILSHMLLD